MKKFMSFLIVMVFGAQSLYAYDYKFMKNIKFYGEGQTVGYSMQNGYDLNLGKLLSGLSNGQIPGILNSNYGGVVSFFTAGLTFDIMEYLSADLSFSYSNNWAEGGNKIFSLANNPSYSPLKGNSIQSYLDNIRVQTANVTIKNLLKVEGLSAKIGRQYYGDEDSSIMYFGVRHYQPLFGLNLPFLGFDNTTSVNAATLYYEKEKMKANFIYANLGQILGTSLNFDGAILNLLFGGSLPFNEHSINLGKDTTVIGADVKLLKIADAFNLQAYGYDIESPLVAHYSIAGIKPAVESGGFKASVEFALNFAGKSPFGYDSILNTGLFKMKGNSNLFKADLSYEMDQKAAARASFAMQGGSEGIEEILNGIPVGTLAVKPFLNFGNYVPGIVFGQQTVTRVLSMVDFRAINVGADYFKNDFKFSFDYYNFAARDNGLNYGDEVDLQTKYKYSDGIDFFLAFGCFISSNDIDSKIEKLTGEEDFLADISSSVQLGASYKF